MRNDRDSSQTIDLNVMAQHFDVNVSSKKAEDPEDAKLRRFKDKWLFVGSLIAIAAMFLICFFILFFRENSPYAGVALNGVIGLTLALAGYYARGRTH